MSPPIPLDRFAASQRSVVAAGIWGFAEATLFFIVPDVLLTLVACRSLRSALRGTVAALVGALLGGVLLVWFGSSSPDTARSFLDHVPGIQPALITSVESQVERQGVRAVLVGPLRGTPYKIYAVEWGARHGELMPFVLVSVPARYLRFLLSALVAHAIARLVERRTGQPERFKITIWAVFWPAFYLLYFGKFGW